MTPPAIARATSGLLFLLMSLPLRAAGGHFDVDDASVLDPGHCQVEVWAVRAPGEPRSAAHVGPACRVGPVELGVNLDHAEAGGVRTTVYGPQIKFVIDPLLPRLAAGVVWVMGFDRHGGRAAHTLYAPFTWFATEALQVHANVGADWSAEGQRTRRLGLAAEWAANDTWSITAERAELLGDRVSRIGLRFNVDASLSIDAIVARAGPLGARTFIIGLNRDFVR